MALRLVDIIFFFAVLILMILIVTLIYFIKINNETEEKDLEETQEMKIAKELRDSMKNSEPTIKFTDYEKDQEDKAIISYDELLNKGNNYELNYEKEEIIYNGGNIGNVIRHITTQFFNGCKKSET